MARSCPPLATLNNVRSNFKTGTPLPVLCVHYLDFVITCMLAGPCPAFLLAFVMRGGKTLENGRMSWSGSIRHLIPAVCPHGTLGQHLALRYTIMGEPFPNPKNFKRWVMTPMWPGTSAKQNLTYQQQYERINKYLRKELGIWVRKVTHIFRVLSARTLDESGVDDHVSPSGLSAFLFYRA